ncbi:hypothetical protein TWF730_005072 [Orbilia blumenaviensis]|uniref:Uncharacterized protein n=1 Tax=Orbilia blumenaviensis TaxID=1796055 RepID=A0AAV9VHM5_9PEZI
MGFSKLLSPCRTTLLLVAILSTAHPSVSAPTSDIGTAVSSAAKPIPNITPNSKGSLIHQETETSPGALGPGDEIKRRGLNAVSGGMVLPSPSVKPQNLIEDEEPPPNPSPKHLGKRQTRPRSFSAPAVLSKPPDAPNTNAEENAIDTAAAKIKEAANDAVNNMRDVANAAVQNAAEEQKEGVDNPSFQGSQDDSYVWPSASPVQPAWPTNGVSTWDPTASAAAAPGGQALQVLDGTGNPIQNDAQEPKTMLSGSEQYFDPILSNEPNIPLQVLDGSGKRLKNGALQPEQYFDPTLFDEPDVPFRVLDGEGNPMPENADGNSIQNNALQPKPMVPGLEQYFDPTLFNEPEQIQVSNGPEQYFDPALFDESQQTASGRRPQYYFDPMLPSQPLQVLSGDGTSLKGGAIQPEPMNSDNTPEGLQPLLDLAETDPTEFASIIDTIDNPQASTPFPAVEAFRNDFAPGQSIHTDTGSTLFTPNGFEMSPVGPFGGPHLLPQLDGINQNFDRSTNQPPLLPQLDGVNQNFDGTISKPLTPSQDIFGGTFGAMPTNVFLPNGGTISLNCVPVYIDANGNQHAASDVPSQILSAFNVGGMPMPITTQSSFTDQTTDPNTPLTPLLSEVVSNNPDAISASQIDDNTVLVNTGGGDDAEKVFSTLGDTWKLEAEATQEGDNSNGYNVVTLDNGGTAFKITQPEGFATANILDAKTPGDILSQISDGASIQLEVTNAPPAPGPVVAA